MYYSNEMQDQNISFTRSSIDQLIEESIRDDTEFTYLNTMSITIKNRKANMKDIDLVLDWYSYYRSQGLTTTLSKYQALWKGTEHLGRYLLE